MNRGTCVSVLLLAIALKWPGQQIQKQKRQRMELFLGCKIFIHVSGRDEAYLHKQSVHI